MPSRSVDEFHAGEIAMHEQFKVPEYPNPTSPGLLAQYAVRVTHSPLVALGTLDAQGRPWTTVWGGERGFAQPVAQDVLGFNSAVDTAHDPVYEALFADGTAEEGAVVRSQGGAGKMMSALAIDLETRDRVKLGGMMVAGAKEAGGKRVQMAMYVTESLGNCPKYLNKKDITPHDVEGDEEEEETVAEGLPLTPEASEVIHKADLFFLSSTDGETMDTNHRGGPPGFVRIERNDAGGVVLVYPEYSGNRLYQSLGNLKVNPLIGIVLMDFEAGDVLYVTGSAAILVGEQASSLIARTNLAVEITVSAARFVRRGLRFRGAPIDFSPYNPPVRRLVAEQDLHQPEASAAASGPSVTAHFARREPLTPSISRFTFRLTSEERLPVWRAGQYITLDFEPELSHGYAHMNDADPQSLNDDFVRTFTVSSPPGPAGKEAEVQITARRNGPATGLLWRHNPRAPLELRVLGFGGDDAFRMPTEEGSGQPVFIAGGVGITPALAQARGVLDGNAGLRVLWALREEDMPLAADAFAGIDGLAAATTLFISGVSGPEPGPGEEKLKAVGATVERRRIGEADVTGLRGAGRRFFLCAAPGLLKKLSGWLDGESVVWEDFGY